MSDLASIAAANKAALSTTASAAPQTNPADSIEAVLNPPARRRIPMSVPVQKLQAPPIPGHYTHWFRGTPDRIQQAMNAGFEWVTPEETRVNNVDIGSFTQQTGNTDLGSRVSVLANTSGDGEIGADGQPIRLYLMKQKWEWHEEDVKLLEDRNASVAEALTSSFKQGLVGGEAPGETAVDAQNRYVDAKRTRIPAFFQRKRGR